MATWAVIFVGGPHDGLEGHTYPNVEARELPRELRLFDPGDGVHIYEPANFHLIPSGQDVDRYLRERVEEDRERATYRYADPNDRDGTPWDEREEDVPNERELVEVVSGGGEKKEVCV